MEANFFDKVYEITRKIPFGKVTTYGAIAKYIGHPQSARMVGWALNKCDNSHKPVPAHRVVNRKGMLTGKNHFPNAKTMEELLEYEGVKVTDSIIQDFEKHFWNPAEISDI